MKLPEAVQRAVATLSLRVTTTFNPWPTSG